MADTNQVQLSYVREATFGTTPASALTNLRITGESFSHTIENMQSNEIRADRQVTALVQADAAAVGGYEFELSYGTLPDAILEAALMGVWGQDSTGVDIDYTGTAEDISFSSTDNSMNSAVTGDFVSVGKFRAGQWVYVSGSDSNDGWHKIYSVAASKVIFTSDTVIVTEVGTGDTIRVVGAVYWTGATLAAGDANGTYTFSAGNANYEGIQVGQWLEIRGFTTEANNGYKLVTAVAANGTTFTTQQTTVLEAQGDTIIVKGSMLRNGDTKHSFTFQRELTDAVQYFAFRGQMVNTFNLNIAAGEIITGSLETMGGDIASTDLAQVSFGTGANVAAPTTDPCTAIANVGSIMESATLAAIASDLYVQSISFTVNNNLRGKKAIGTLGNVGIGAGKCDVEGTINALFNDETLYDKYLAGTPTALSFKVEDPTGNAYIFTFRNIEFQTDDGGKATGNDADVVENIGFKALRHTDTDCTIQIDKFAA